MGHGISRATGAWSFDGSVPEVFEDHIRQSVPGYDEGHDLVCALSDFFCLPDSICYEIGASTGSLIAKLAAHHRAGKPAIRWIGVDNVQPMVDVARKQCADLPNVELVCGDARDLALEKSDFVVSYYAVQFVPPRDRQALIDKIYAALNWGGGFIWFEKVRGPDARFQDMISNMYVNFKLSHGFTAEEIINKTESLKTVLEPFSSQGNLDLLKRAGFQDIMPIYRNICFEGLVCIK
jgi:tRNA (cmo5U34)-methyltransferase